MIYLIQSSMAWDGTLCCEEFDLHADICYVGSGFLATDYMSFIRNPGTKGKKVRPNRLSEIYRSRLLTPCYL